MRVVRLVFVKELMETLRDRRTLLTIVLIPVFLYPVLFVLMEQLALVGKRNVEARPSVVAVSDGAPPALVSLVRADSMLELAAESEPADALPSGDAGLEARVQGGALDAALVVGPVADDEETARAEVVFDAARDGSREARERLEGVVEAWGDSVLAGRLRTRGLPESFAAPVELSERSVATAERLGGYLLGRILPLILILMTVLGAFYPAIDLSAGEKERGTLETLLTTSVPAREIVAGKFAAVALISLVAATLNLTSMLVTFQSGLFRFSAVLDEPIRLPPTAIVLVVAGLVPLAVLFSALFLGIGVRVHSTREAQTALMPFYIGSFVPALMVTVGIDFTPLVALVPVGGLALLFRALMAGDVPALPAAIALLSTVAYAGIALWFAARAFGSERVLFGDDSGGAEAVPLRERLAGWFAGPDRTETSTGRARPSAAQAILFAAAVGLLYFHFGARLMASWGEAGLLTVQWGLLAGAAVLTALRFDPRETLALRRPPARTLPGALMLIVGGIPVGWAINWLRLRVMGFEMSDEMAETLMRLVSADDPGRFLWLLFVVALTPAVCEELVFRGVVLQGLASRGRAVSAVVISALVFATFHLSTETVIRFAPTAWLGLLLGFAVWRTRSVWTGTLMHFVNNGLTLTLVSTGLGEALLGDAGRPPWWMVAAGAATAAAGAWLLLRTTETPDGPRPPDPPASETVAERVAAGSA